MNLNQFKIHFAKRNILANKKNSLVIIITLSLIFCLFILLAGLKPTSVKIYELNQIDKYEDIDIVISYDEYSSSRLINRRTFEDEYDDYTSYSLSFFNLDVLVDIGEPKYVRMMSSLPHEFEVLVDDDVLILENEVIITKSLSEKFDLSIGDSFNFVILDNHFTYTVGDIFQDVGQFSGDAFYMDKQILMSALYDVNLPNLGNILYINTHNESEIAILYDLLEGNESYDNYSITLTVDWDVIEDRANELVSMFLAIGIIVIIAVTLVLGSLFPIISKDIPKQIGVVKTLGGDKSFVWRVYLFQWLIYSFISFLIGVLLSLTVVNIGLSVARIKGFIPLNMPSIIIALFAISIYVLLRARISYLNECKKSGIALSKGERYQKYIPHDICVIIAAFIFVIEIVFNFLSLEYHALVLVLTSVYLTFNLLSYSLIIISKRLIKKRKSLFSIFQVKYLQDNKNLHHSLRVLIMSLIALIMIFSFRLFMDNQLTEIHNVMTYDLAVSNIYDLDQDLIEEINTYDVDNSTPSALYRNTSITVGDGVPEFCRYIVSLNFSEYDNYFGNDIYGFDDKYLDNEEVYIILPKNYEMIYDLKVGDVVIVDVNYLMEDVPMYIGGFLDTDFDNFAYTNISEVDAYQALAKYNTILLNSTEKDDLYVDLINDYSGRMYYIINPDLYFESLISDVVSVLNFFSVFTLFIVFCFVIIIFNNTVLIFNSLKTDLAKIKSLGADKSIFLKSIMKEYGLISLLILIIGLLEIIILSDNIRYLVLFTNYYKDITATYTTTFIGCGLVLIVLLISYIYYMYNISNLKIIEQIKF